MTSPLGEIPSSDATRGARPAEPRDRVEQALDSLPPPEAADGVAGSDTPHRGELVAPVQRINEVMRPYGVEFELDEATSRLVTRLVDRETGETIRQIPAEEVLRIAERLEELQGKLIRLEA
ncbi:flagellar protein FlaG [Halomonas beimenensis]|uniref:Flagellar protein FlaG n=1 Tax=Halomonas beimenensis TaxID=475662 RepID=A0A291PCQ8_9GAMM|nr:flagellar protein FlaG [Halomonas beimenensis]ATJ84662.1 flagellar protein FlaG [Halomonas beimenensis]